MNFPLDSNNIDETIDQCKTSQNKRTNNRKLIEDGNVKVKHRFDRSYRLEGNFHRFRKNDARSIRQFREEFSLIVLIFNHLTRLFNQDMTI